VVQNKVLFQRRPQEQEQEQEHPLTTPEMTIMLTGEQVTGGTTMAMTDLTTMTETVETRIHTIILTGGTVIKTGIITL
jgi:adenylylsulfate kinase-like enzyme